jgi:hypothetical protein
MTAPTAKVREAVYRRDGHCVSCGALDGWNWQHRASSGHGGRGKKAPPLTPADGVVLCGICNDRAEGDMQELALLSGWKVRRHSRMRADELPYRDAVTGLWWLPDTDGYRSQVTHKEAVGRLLAGGNLTRKKVA